MFHPTVFDNIKVVLEGAVYDLDLAGEIVVLNRADFMDLASFQRLYQLDFRLGTESDKTQDKPGVTAQIQLSTTLSDIAAEQLEQPITDHVGCHIYIHFQLKVSDLDHEPMQIVHVLNQIWGHRPHITQVLGITLDEHKSWQWPPQQLENRITLDFHRKIDEGNMEDIYSLVHHCLQSLGQLEAVIKRG